MPNYGLLPVSSGKLGADGRIALDGIAASGKEPYDGRYTVEVSGQQLGHFRVEDRPSLSVPLPMHPGLEIDSRRNPLDPDRAGETRPNWKTIFTTGSRRKTNSTTCAGRS